MTDLIVQRIEQTLTRWYHDTNNRTNRLSKFEALHFETMGNQTPSSLCKLTGDASNRIYYRLKFKVPSLHTVMAMVLPEESTGPEEVGSEVDKDSLPFINLQSYLKALSLPVPEIYFYDKQSKIMLLADLGDCTLEHQILSEFKAPCFDAYKPALDTLILFQAAFNNQQPPFPYRREFNQTLLMWELDHYLEYGIEEHYGNLVELGQKNLIRNTFRVISKRLSGLPKTLCHRDYQSRNLMFVDNQMVVIDFQDALPGPVVYDLVALLCDSYLPIPRNLTEEALSYYCTKGQKAGLPWCDNLGTLMTWFDLQTIQRKLKDAGRFVFIDRVKNNPSFLPHIDQSLRYVKGAFLKLNDPYLNTLFNLLTTLDPKLEQISI